MPLPIHWKTIEDPLFYKNKNQLGVCILTLYIIYFALCNNLLISVYMKCTCVYMHRYKPIYIQHPYNFFFNQGYHVQRSKTLYTVCRTYLGIWYYLQSSFHIPVRVCIHAFIYILHIHTFRLTFCNDPSCLFYWWIRIAFIYFIFIFIKVSMFCVQVKRGWSFGP
jgi:hypothetical protein